MFSDMRLKAREISKDQSEVILNQSQHGVLSLAGTNGYPYAVPMSYAYEDGTIWLHGSKEGLRAALIQANKQCCFCVAETLDVVQEKFTVKYQSVILYGHLSEVFGDEAKTGLYTLIKKYSPDFLDEGKAYIDQSAEKTCVLKITITHLTGKSQQ